VQKIRLYVYSHKNPPSGVQKFRLYVRREQKHHYKSTYDLMI